MSPQQLEKAAFTRLDTLESLEVLWNPGAYRTLRAGRFAAPVLADGGRAPLQLAGGGGERFAARLFFDSTEIEGEERDLTRRVGRLASWADLEGGASLPPRVLFHWGPFRFRGVIEELRQEWVRFDPDGIPLRAWVDIVLRR